MIHRVLAAVVVLVVVGLALVYLLGPVLETTDIPFVVILGQFFVKWGWVLALAAAIWHYVSGSVWPLRRQ